MAFEYRFNVIRFYSKLNRFVLSPRKKPNHFVLKIRPGGFADYTWSISSRHRQKVFLMLSLVSGLWGETVVIEESKAQK